MRLGLKDVKDMDGMSDLLAHYLLLDYEGHTEIDKIDILDYEIDGSVCIVEWKNLVDGELFKDEINIWKMMIFIHLVNPWNIRNDK